MWLQDEKQARNNDLKWYYLSENIMISTHGWHKSLPSVWMCHTYRQIFVIGSLYLGLSMVGNQPKKKEKIKSVIQNQQVTMLNYGLSYVG